MDIVDQMAADIAMKMNGGEWTDGKWYSQGHRDAWVKAVQPYADEIVKLRDALSEAIEVDWYALTPTGETMISRWRSALQQKEKE